MRKILPLCLASALTLLLGCSSGSIITDAKPDAPTGVTATAGSGQVTLSWSPTIAAAGYTIYFSNTSGVTPASPNRIGGLTTTTYIQTPVTHGIPYFYVITASNGDGESLPSAQVSANP